MSEPSSPVPEEVPDAEVEEPSTAESEADVEEPSTEESEVEQASTEDDAPSTVELDVDQEKVEAWDDVKGDYQVEPDGEPIPNTMGEDDRGLDESPDADADAEQS